MKLQANAFAVDIADFDPDATFNCGQCFRWERREDGSYSGIAYAKKLTVRREGKLLLLCGADRSDFETVWKDYFDLARDYRKIRELFCSDPVMKKAIAFAPGLRILRQEPWEALCSFILSQNNNIPRIKGIISRLCGLFGERIEGGYAFPGAERLAALSESDLAPVRSGFRAGYVLGAARKVASGDIDLKSLRNLPLGQARETLQTIRGVGPKVADCTLLFGCGRLDCFPVDVWIRRALAEYYPQGFPKHFSSLRGIAQQFLFHYVRNCPQCG